MFQSSFVCHPQNRKKNMGLVNMQNQSMNLVLSTDAKPRLKWTQELHQRFVEAVNQLGGADKATPKSVMRVMGIPGLTLYHLKSHLQKFRLGKSQQSQTSIEIKQEDYKEIQSSDDPVNSGTDFKEIQTHDGTVNSRNEDGPVNNDSINESLQIAQALQLQMEVQKKLHEQIEVQRHLQLRIEAQGKYLQSVLKKAQETLAGYTCSSPSAVGIEFARAELSKLASMVSDGYPSSSISEVTETGGCSSLVDTERKQLRSTVCSLESSLISSESTGRKDRANAASVELPLMEIHPQDRAWNKRSGSGSVSDGVCVEQPLAKRPKNGEQLRKSGLLVTLDLNSQYQNEFE